MSARELVLRGMVVVVVVLGCAGLALYTNPARGQGAGEHACHLLAACPGCPEPTPLLPFEARCRADGAEAAVRAASLERLARSRWERAPFAPAEAPRAAQRIAEAEACYQAARDRAGRARAATLRARYESAILERFAAAHRSLHVAQGAARAEALRTLRALLGQPELAP